MAQNSDNIVLARPKIAGAMYIAAKGTEVPAGVTEEAAAFKSAGWLSEDGITMAIDRQTTDLVGMGGDTALVITSSHTVTFTVRPLELNPITARAMFGSANVTVVGEKVTAINVNSKELEEFALMFDLHGRNDQLIRVCSPVAKITDFADVSIKHDDASFAPEWTITVTPDAAGNKAYIHFGEAA